MWPFLRYFIIVVAILVTAATAVIIDVLVVAVFDDVHVPHDRQSSIM